MLVTQKRKVEHKHHLILKWPVPQPSLISSVTAGVVGGVTSQVSKWKAAEVVHGAGNTTMKVTGPEARMVGRMFVA